MSQENKIELIMIPKKEKRPRGRKLGTKAPSAQEVREKRIKNRRKQRQDILLRRKHKEEVKKRKAAELAKQKLIPTQEAVVEEFFKCFNKTRAYIRVFGDVPNAAKLAYAIFSSEKVKAEIAQRLAGMKYTNEQTQIMFQDRAEASIEDFTRYNKKLGGLVYDDKKAEKSGRKHLIKKIQCFKSGTIKNLEIAEPEFSLDKVAKIQQQYSDAPVLPPIDTGKGKNPLREILDIIHAKKNSSDSTGK